MKCRLWITGREQEHKNTSEDIIQNFLSTCVCPMLVCIVDNIIGKLIFLGWGKTFLLSDTEQLVSWAYPADPCSPLSLILSS